MEFRHVVIIPFYNEELYLKICIESIKKQTLKPTQLILVDDNSTDNSPEIAKKFSEEYNWIKYVKHVSSDKKEQGAKVIRAFNFGLSCIDLKNYSFISKLDADLEFPPDYFEEIKECFVNPKIGLAGGKIVEIKNDKWVEIPQASYHVRGALKTYRSTCFEDIGGLIPVLGWDGLDEMNIFYRGWNTSIMDIQVKHFRIASSDYNPILLNREKGKSAYKNGANLLLTILRMINKFKDKPYVFGGLNYFSGYLNAWYHKDEVIVDKKLAGFINMFHLKRILRLK